MQDAADHKIMIGGRFQKWFQEKGYGFVMVRGTTVFVPPDSVRLRGHLQVGGRVGFRVIAYPCKGEGMWKATEAWLESDFQAECAIQATVKATYEAEKTAKQAMAKAAQAVKQSEGIDREDPGAARTCGAKANANG